MYRLIWGWNRLAWIGGKFEDRAENGSLIREVVQLRFEPKYPWLHRWILERWYPPEYYGTPYTWYANTIERENGESIPALGPYPYQGDYEQCSNEVFKRISPLVVDLIVRGIQKASRSAAERIAEHKAQEEAETKRREQEDLDMLNECTPAFGHGPMVSRLVRREAQGAPGI